MTIHEIPLIQSRPTPNPQTPPPGLDPQIGDTPKPRETTASKKVDDLSRHESNHDLPPKHEPKLNAREKDRGSVKPGGTPGRDDQTPLDTTKK
ncbi:hypothetical protein [Geothrix sp.]|jgi:hypothetical protein|uniref:hypothetical protein n=1 Tax=Geothrix sp. TaxID=1962974 RepID=UPI0025C0F1D9|nr:hypothetical protein [Geothrix sp.]